MDRAKDKYDHYFEYPDTIVNYKPEEYTWKEFYKYLYDLQHMNPVDVYPFFLQVYNSNDMTWEKLARLVRVDPSLFISDRIKGRLYNLRHGKVLDASGMNSDGTNIRSINTPMPRSMKKGFVNNFKIVSNNANNYAIVMAALNDDQTDTSSLILEYFKKFLNNPSFINLPMRRN